VHAAQQLGARFDWPCTEGSLGWGAYAVDSRGGLGLVGFGPNEYDEVRLLRANGRLGNGWISLWKLRPAQPEETGEAAAVACEASHPAARPAQDLLPPVSPAVSSPPAEAPRSCPPRAGVGADNTASERSVRRHSGPRRRSCPALLLPPLSPDVATSAVAAATGGGGGGGGGGGHTLLAQMDRRLRIADAQLRGAIAPRRCSAARPDPGRRRGSTGTIARGSMRPMVAPPRDSLGAVLRRHRPSGRLEEWRRQHYGQRYTPAADKAKYHHAG
jgi:hypothetical protein